MELFFIGLLILASIVGIAIIVERGLSLRWRKVIPINVQVAVETFKNEADFKRVLDVSTSNPSPLSRLLQFISDHQDWTKTENSEALQTRARHEIIQLERGLVILEIIIGIAPLLGLVGTIYGLIMLFGSLGAAGDNSK